MIDHAEVRELLELAAVEPGGLDRLEAGDTIEAAAVAGHLAGCPSCLEELFRLRRSSGIIRDLVVAETADEQAPVALPPELKERTLALVRAVGVPRGVAAAPAPALAAAPATAASAAAIAPATAVTASVPGSQVPPAPSVVPASSRTVSRLRFARPAAWVASIAAAIVLSVVATTALLGTGSGDRNGLAEVVRWSVDMGASSDARHIVLTSAATGEAKGELTVAPATGALVVVVPELGAAPSGEEYRCWLQTATGRTWVGKMTQDEGISYWVGTVPSLAAAPAGTTFGISLESAGGTTINGAAVLRGGL